MSRFLHLVKRIITLLVTGIVVLLIGLTLIKVGLIRHGGGYGALADGSFASHNLFLSLLVLRPHRADAAQSQPWLRLSAIMIAMLAGYAVALLLGKVAAPTFDGPLLMVPVPLHYGLGFDWQLFVPLAIIFVVTALEAIGDMTATSDISGEPLEGPVYMARIRGVLADGANSMLAAVFSTFPMSTFAQNNGVIQLTGVASRHVGLFIAAMLALLGLFPAVASLVQQIPEPVLGGATIVMFGTIAAAGCASSPGGAGPPRPDDPGGVARHGSQVAQVPEVLQHLPELARSVLSYGVATGGLTAILLNLLLPRRAAAQA